MLAGLNIQWGNTLAALVIWVLGSLITWRVQRFHITATMWSSFIALAFRAHTDHRRSLGSRSRPITGPMYQLFIFFMITDPKTTVRSRTGQCVVAFTIALVEFFMRLDSSIYAPLYALFWVGPAALFIEMALDTRRKRAASSTPVLNPAPGGSY